MSHILNDSIMESQKELIDELRAEIIELKKEIENLERRVRVESAVGNELAKLLDGAKETIRELDLVSDIGIKYEKQLIETKELATHERFVAAELRAQLSKAKETIKELEEFIGSYKEESDHESR